MYQVDAIFDEVIKINVLPIFVIFNNKNTYFLIARFLKIRKEHNYMLRHTKLLLHYLIKVQYVYAKIFIAFKKKKKLCH